MPSSSIDELGLTGGSVNRELDEASEALDRRDNDLEGITRPSTERSANFTCFGPLMELDGGRT